MAVKKSMRWQQCHSPWKYSPPFMKSEFHMIWIHVQNFTGTSISSQLQSGRSSLMTVYFDSTPFIWPDFFQMSYLRSKVTVQMGNLRPVIFSIGYFWSYFSWTLTIFIISSYLGFDFPSSKNSVTFLFFLWNLPNDWLSKALKVDSGIPAPPGIRPRIL